MKFLQLFLTFVSLLIAIRIYMHLFSYKKYPDDRIFNEKFKNFSKNLSDEQIINNRLPTDIVYIANKCEGKVKFDCNDNYKYIGNTRFPSNQIVHRLKLNGDNCVEKYYKSVCTNNFYTKSFSSRWMYYSKNYINNERLTNIFLPGSHDAMTYGIDKSSVHTGSDASKQKRVIMSTLPEISVNWSKTQMNDIYEQLESGIRYFDLRLCVYVPFFYDFFNIEYDGTYDDLVFTHSIVTTKKDSNNKYIANFDKMIDDIDRWINDYNAFEEIIILNFNRILNLCTTNPDLYKRISDKSQIEIQQKVMDKINNKWGSRLSPKTIAINNTYDFFIKRGYQFIIMFDTEGKGGENKHDNDLGVQNAIVPNVNNNNPDSLNFVDYWSRTYQWVRKTNTSITGGKAICWKYNNNGSPKDCYDCAFDEYSDQNLDINTFNIFGAVTGMVNDWQGIADLVITNNLLDYAGNWAPVLINNFLHYYYPDIFFDGGEFNIPINPPYSRKHNIFMYDNVCASIVPTLIIAANRGPEELLRVVPKLLPSTNDNQCKYTTVGCKLDKDYYYIDPTTCEKRGTRCYSTTGTQCQSNLDCSTISGGCKSATGSAYYCNYKGTSCQCTNPNLQTCSNDNHCVWEKKAQKCSGIAGYNDSKCKRKGLTDKCECKN